MKPISISKRRVAAFFGAVAILLCVGCKGKEDCSTFRSKFISDIGWDKLQTTTCLSTTEKNTLANERALFDRANLVSLLEAETVQEVLQEAAIKPDSKLLEEIAKGTSEIQQGQPSGQSSSGPWIIPRAVLFLYEGGHESEEQQPSPAGTAFIVTVPQLNNPGRFLRFLVTARHLVDWHWAKCDKGESLFLRFNKKNGLGTALVPLNLQPKLGKVLYVPSDPHSDLAAILLRPQLFPNFDDYEILDVPFRVTASPDDMHVVREGTAVITAGLDPELPGTSSNSPVFRQGVISRVNNELIKAQASCGSVPIEVHSELLSAPLHPGNSGAPVYVTNGRGGNKPVLVGIQSFVFEQKQLAGMTPATDLIPLFQDSAKDLNVQLDLYQGVKKE